MKVEAYPLGGSSYAIVGDTFHMKDKIKELGGKWNAEHKFWILPIESVKQIAPAMIWADVDTGCHEGIKPQWIPESRVHAGQSVETWCSMCDSNGLKGKVVNVYPEHHWH